MNYRLLNAHEWFDKSLSYAASTLAPEDASLDAICKRALEALDDLYFQYTAMYEGREENYEELISSDELAYTNDMIEIAKRWVTALRQGMLHKDKYNDFVIAERKAVRYNVKKKKIVWRKTKSFVKTSN